MTEQTPPEWLVPGAEVVLYTLGSAGYPRRPVVTTVKKLNKRSFTVERPGEPRFDLVRLSAREGGSWGTTRMVLRADSDMARKELEEERRLRLAERAVTAVDEWRRTRTREARLNAIAALRRVEDEPDD